MAKLLIPFAVLALAVAAALWGDHPQPPADYTVINGPSQFTLDPQRMSYEQDFRIAHAIYDGVVRWDPYTFEIIPGLAERWTVSDDRLTHTFHFREGLRWSNGDPITPADVVYSWRRALLPDLAADYSSMFFAIRGGEEFFRWRAEQLAQYASRPASERTLASAIELRDEAFRRFGQTVGIETPDDRTLIVHLERPIPYFLDLCAFPVFFPIHPPSVERFVRVNADSGALEQRHDWTKPPRTVTSGAYRITSWRFKRDLRLEKNPDYWDAARVRAQAVQVLLIEDTNTRFLTYETGGADWDIDVLVQYAGDLVEMARDGVRDDIHGYDQFGTYFWSFNCTPTLTGGRPNPFHDPRVRRAFALSVNKQDLVDKVRRTGEAVADTLIPPGSIPGFDEERTITGLHYDPQRARAELEAAGWADRDGDSVPEDAAGTPFPVVELLCSTGSYHEKIALAMGDMWRRHLGVRTRLVRKESKTYKDDLKRRDYMMARGGWFGDYGDPTTFLYLHRTGDGNNDRGYSDPVFDDLLDRAENAADPDERMRLLEEAERYTMEEALPILPLWRYRRIYAFDPARLSGVSAHPRLEQYFHWIAPRSPGDSSPVRPGDPDPDAATRPFEPATERAG